MKPSLSPDTRAALDRLTGRSRYLSMQHAAAQFGWPSGAALRKWCHRHPELIVLHRQGRNRVVLESDLEAVVRREQHGHERTAIRSLPSTASR